MFKKQLIVSIFLMILIGLFAVMFAFSKYLNPTKAQMYSYQVKNYIGDMKLNESKRIDWIHGTEVLVARTNNSSHISSDYSVLILNKFRNRDKDFYFVQVTDNRWDTFGYCGFTSLKYTFKNMTSNGVIYCNYGHIDKFGDDYTGLVFDLNGNSMKFANAKLEKPFYRISSDGYITLNITEF